MVTIANECIAILCRKNCRETSRVGTHYPIEQIAGSFIRSIIVLNLHVQFHRYLGSRGNHCGDVALEQIFLIVHLDIERSLGWFLKDTVLVEDGGIQEVIDFGSTTSHGDVQPLVHSEIIKQ